MSRGGHNWQGGETVEATRALDVMTLARAGYMSGHRGAWQWTHQDGTKAWIEIRGGKDQIVLDYRFRSRGEDWQEVRQSVPIRWTPCRFGGERPWFVCDVRANGVYCGRRVTKLYGAGQLFACRQCYRLGYAVQRSGPIDRAHRHLVRLHRKLGMDHVELDGLPPAKPKWMRWETYDRIARDIEAGKEWLEHAFTAKARRLPARTHTLKRGRKMRR